MCQMCIEASAAESRKNWLASAIEELEKFEETDPEPAENNEDNKNTELTTIHTQVRLLRNIVTSMYHSMNN